MYLVKGIEQREYRMLQFDQSNPGPDNQANATHYDPRFDGSLRFKLYFKTNLYYEVVTQVNLTSSKFTEAYLTTVK